MARGLPIEKFDFCEKVGILVSSILIYLTNILKINKKQGPEDEAKILGIFGKT